MNSFLPIKLLSKELKQTNKKPHLKDEEQAHIGFGFLLHFPSHEDKPKAPVFINGSTLPAWQFSKAPYSFKAITTHPITESFIVDPGESLHTFYFWVDNSFCQDAEICFDNVFPKGPY